MSRSRALASGICFTLLAVFVVACSNGGGGLNGADGGLSKLSPEQQQAFQAWLKTPVKSCQAIEVVGGAAQGIEKGLDLKVLAERTGGSLWLSNASKPDFFALLSGGATGFTTGVATSRFEQTITINGSAQSVKVETKSSGFDCIVKINDVDVAQLSIAKSVDLALAGSSQLKFKDVAMPLASAWQTYDGVTAVDVASWMRAIDTTLRQQATAETLAVGLGYSDAEAKKFFVVRGLGAGSGFGLELTSPVGRTAFAGNAEVVLDPTQAKLLPEAGQTKNVSVVSMYRTGGVSIGGVRFGAGSSEVMIVRRIVGVANSASTITLQDLGLRSTMSIVPTAEMADACVFDRALNYSNLYRAKLRARIATELPSRRILFGACETLEPEIQNRYDRTDLSLRALNTLLAAVSRSMIEGSGVTFSFGDWSSFVVSEIVRALDPKSSSTLARMVDVAMINEIDKYVATAKLTSDYAKMDPALLPVVGSAILSLTGSTRGAVTESAVVRRIVQAAVKVGPVYAGPLLRVSQKIPSNMASVEDSLSWVESRATPSLLQAGREALAEAQAINYEKFQRDFEFFFSERPTEQDLLAQRDEMKNLKVQMAAYPALAAIKREIVDAVYKNPNFLAKDLPATLNATSQLIAANDELAREFLTLVKTSSDAQTVTLARDWSKNLKAGDAQAIRSFLNNAQSGGYLDEATKFVRSMVRSRPSSADLATLAAASALSKQFLVDEAGRAAGSTSDMFYESDAKTMAKRIALEAFTAADVASLEAFAQVAASDVFCRSRKTVSYRLQCEGLDAFSKLPGKLLAPEYQGRNASLAGTIAGWMNRLQPETNHSSVRRTIKQALFASDSGPWEKCNLSQFEVNKQGLESAMQAYIQVMADFSARFKAERAVSAAVEARCP